MSAEDQQPEVEQAQAEFSHPERLAADVVSDISPEQFAARIAELEASTKDIQARANADMYNFQKRVERETDNAKKYALEKFSTSMLDVVDNLERALVAAGDQESALVEGVRLTYKSLLSALEKHGVQMIDPQDQPFNADLHQAVGIAPDAPADQVGQVLQKGYSLNGRLLRPAMVMVGQ
jgi:molecular chaperone GrpE